MKFFVYIKDSSERVPDKNFLPLDRKPLWHHLIEELNPHNVYIDTDSQRVLDDCEKMDHVTAYMRDPEHIRLETDKLYGRSPVPLMIERFLDEYVPLEDELVCTPHVTSPFLRIQTIVSACVHMFRGYDTVQSCTKHKEFCYFDGKPINFNPSIIQKTQDLEPVVMGNGAFFIFTKRSFKRYNNRTGLNPFFYTLKGKEAIEIDNQEDYDLARWCV